MKRRTGCRHVVDEHDVIAVHARGAKLECAAYVRSPRCAAEESLRRAVPGPHERIRCHHNSAARCECTREPRGRTETAATQPLEIGRNRYDQIRVATRRYAPRCQKVGEAAPRVAVTPIFEAEQCVRERRQRRRPRIAGTRRPIRSDKPQRLAVKKSCPGTILDAARLHAQRAQGGGEQCTARRASRGRQTPTAKGLANGGKYGAQREHSAMLAVLRRSRQ